VSSKGRSYEEHLRRQLEFVATPEAVRSLFEPLGTIRNFKLMTDRDSGLSRGFAFIEMTEVEAGPAIAALDGRIVDGRTIEVRGAVETPPPRRIAAAWIPATIPACIALVVGFSAGG
jgi:hypothetical protein